MPKKKNFDWELLQVPLIGEPMVKILRGHGIERRKQLAELPVTHKLSEISYSFPLVVNYAKAIEKGETILNKDITSPFDTIDDENIYFFDAEYDSTKTQTGPYAAFLLGWMDRDGNIHQHFLDDPEDEMKILREFSEWVKRENPLLITYGSKSGDGPELGKCFSRYHMSFTHINNAFFDLYAEVIFTQNVKKQKYFLPIVKSGYKPLGLKKVSESVGYYPSDLKITEGMLAQLEYERYLGAKHQEEKETIKQDLLKYNQDDLKRIKFIYDILKKKIILI